MEDATRVPCNVNINLEVGEDEDQKTCSVGPFKGYASKAIIVRLLIQDQQII